MRKLAFVVFVTFVLGAQAQPVEPGALAAAISKSLTVWVSPSGKVFHAKHCRKIAGGCRPRLRAFAKILWGAAKSHGLDPYLLAAIAKRESNFNPGAVGPVGEGGIMQLHPRQKHARGTMWFRSANYRSHCLRLPGACQAEIVGRAAELLEKCIRRCGNIRGALGMYNSGKCRPGLSYVSKVLAERERMKAAGDHHG